MHACACTVQGGGVAPLDPGAAAALCSICKRAAPPPTRRGCGCQGGAALAHLACQIGVPEDADWHETWGRGRKHGPEPAGPRWATCKHCLKDDKKKKGKKGVQKGLKRGGAPEKHAQTPILMPPATLQREPNRRKWQFGRPHAAWLCQRQAAGAARSAAGSRRPPRRCKPDATCRCL